jgi:hypothetical protein
VIEAELGDIAHVAAVTRQIMVDAAIAVIGAPIPVDCKITRYPDRVHDDDGEADFQTLMGMLEAIEGEPGNGLGATRGG